MHAHAATACIKQASSGSGHQVVLGPILALNAEHMVTCKCISMLLCRGRLQMCPCQQYSKPGEPSKDPLQKPPAQHSSCLLRALLARPRPSTPSPSMVLYLLCCGRP